MRYAAWILLCAICLIPGWAKAYIPSPQHGAFELKFGPHRVELNDFPTNDGEVSLKDIFNDRSMFSTNLELDWQFARIDEVVSFGLGFSWGMMSMEEKALVDADEDGDASETSSDDTLISAMPFALLGVVRLDVLADKLSIPFVPYVKAGPNWYLWWTKKDDKRDNSGGTLGWQVNPGLALRLDWIDRTAARTFDNEIGVNHSYLFFEFMFAKIDGGGDGGKAPFTPINIGDSGTWFIGLCLEF